ncbi:glycosyltransferase involved in cell wall biosynthesis [Methanolinea mesophila]|uniref:glycosyltransferase family 4 protein n=1 Tax=Methanolinea mesophila TaxID=547055 RepID=UPI001AE5802B|nr:glycosyltransferase involved in cell wall biosynthesis [Methanolinea mesophila]
MEPHKIAFFCWESLYSVKVGGLSPAATYLAEMLARHHEVHFFTRGEGEGRAINGVRYHYCQPHGENIIAFSRDMCTRLLRRFEEYDDPPFDIIHFHDWHFVEAMDALRSRNTVLTFHSTEYGRNGGNFGDWWEFGEISAKEWYQGYIARQVTTVSKHTKTEVMWLYGVPEDKITVVPNGISPDRYRLTVDPGEVKMTYGIHPLAPVVLFVGRLVYQKGPDLLVAAIPLVLRKRWDVQFLVAGEGPMRAVLEEQSRSLPVQFLGFLPEEEHLRVLNACDLVVIPSRNEPFGLVLTEAWSAGRGVIATEVGGLSENIDNFVDGIKVPVRPESIAWGINHVIDDPVRMRALGVAGRRKVLAKFNWDTVTAGMEDVYRKTLGEGADAGA